MDLRPQGYDSQVARMRYMYIVYISLLSNLRKQVFVFLSKVSREFLSIL